MGLVQIRHRSLEIATHSSHSGCGWSWVASQNGFPLKFGYHDVMHTGPYCPVDTEHFNFSNLFFFQQTLTSARMAVTLAVNTRLAETLRDPSLVHACLGSEEMDDLAQVSLILKQVKNARFPPNLYPIKALWQNVFFPLFFVFLHCNIKLCYPH